ncbi:transcriptional enhancer factor TEF-1 [Eurytemora carolleeae]|uniref:transcriptional enhancer factor TEF-1 n=1 Tax=Eurytemora carolleeae TaxID=1294199 RepID=UPI000C7563DA|nr:transcriptional enhancer factor TEF-1 [Eurytemora carolleeae]|eukprot:XP_023344115.1 transcriptional enhancer factor TEF-1-like [Eurytemora affinis]
MEHNGNSRSPQPLPYTMHGTDAVRIPGLAADISQQIAKYDSSEFDDDKEVQGGDAEGVWAPDIEQSFQEALAIYPPCGRRKIILSDEGKMYGRNELIARYIKLRTGKTRTRKQVRFLRYVFLYIYLNTLIFKLVNQLLVPGQGPTSYLDAAQREKALQSMQQMSSAQIVSATANMHPSYRMGPPVSYGGFWQHPGLGQTQDVKPFAQNPFLGDKPPSSIGMGMSALTGAAQPTSPAWQGRSISTQKLRLVEFSAFVEQQREPETYNKHLFVQIGGAITYSDPLLEPVDVRQIQDKFPEKKEGLKDLYEKGPQDAFFLVKFWADLNTSISEDAGAFYGVTSTCYLFLKQLLNNNCLRFEGGRFLYKLHRSPMCEYMINFILKLKHLPEKYMMNSVLENFTILQVITNRDTGETLLCTAYVFEVSTSEHGAQHHIYKLIKE